MLDCKKRFAIFPSPVGMSLFPARESLVSDIPAGDRIIVNIFLQCRWQLDSLWQDIRYGKALAASISTKPLADHQPTNPFRAATLAFFISL